MDLVCRIGHSVEIRDWFNVWKLARIYAGKNRGGKKRNFRAARTWHGSLYELSLIHI